MAEIIWVFALVSLASWFSWSLGVRRERGRQMRLEEIQRHVKEERKKQKGTTLRTIRVRR